MPPSSAPDARGDVEPFHTRLLVSALLLSILVLAAGAGAQAQPAARSGPRRPAARVPVEEVSIASLQAAYRSGRTSARAITQAHLDRIAAYDRRGPLLNALITVNPDALAEAERLDELWKSRGEPFGPLHGIPVIVKDNIDVAGMPMTSGFQGWKNYRPPADAPLVAKIRAAGGILAKSSLSEFARGLADNINSVVPGFARNPYHTAYATGGSSGGTAVAIAASFGVVGIGTDTGGSVRAPSAHNALVGLRPTVGLVSRTGMVPLNSVRDTAGPMARSVADLTVLLGVIAGPDGAAATSLAAGHIPRSYSDGLSAAALKRVRLGVLRQVFAPAVTDHRIIEHFAGTLRRRDVAKEPVMSQISRGQIQDLVTKFASENPKYRQALIADPKSVIEKQLNVSLGGVALKALVETADVAYVVVPHVPAEGELSDSDLEKVAGGFLDKNANCNNSPGAMNTFVQINL